MNSLVLTYMLQSCTFVFHFSYLGKTCHLSITWKWKWKWFSRVQLFATPWSPWNSPGQNTGVGSLSLLQRIFPTQGSNPGLPHCRQILYQLSHKGSPRIQEKVAYPFSSGSFGPRNQIGISCIAGGFFTNWAMREALLEKLWKFSVTNIVFKMSSTKHRTEDYSWGKYFLEKTMIENSSF